MRAFAVEGFGNNLSVQSGLAFQEIAQLQGISSSTVRGRYRYGIDKLRKRVCEPADGRTR